MPITNWMTHINDKAMVSPVDTVEITSASGLNCSALLKMLVDIIGLLG